MLIFIVIIEILIIMLSILGIVILTIELNNNVVDLEEYIKKTFIRLWLFLMIIGVMSVNLV